MSTLPPSPLNTRRIFMVGATGTIGQATLRALLSRGHQVLSFQRPSTQGRSTPESHPLLRRRYGSVQDPESIRRDGLAGEHFDAVVSCLASRNGQSADAWAIDKEAHCHVLQAAQEAGTRQFVLLSAICVQKPLLPFQHAKLAFEQALIDSGLNYSIVRPTAFFKSLSGQIERVRRGQAFMVLGDGELTACKPISDNDLADFLAGCLDDPMRQRRILPIGGPGPAITPRQQAQMLSELLGRPVPLRRVPVAVLRGIAAVLDGLGRVSPALKAKAELARIGLYYATESMLWRNPTSGQYDADATPEWGHDTLRAHYAQLLSGKSRTDLGEHSVF